MSAPDDFCMVVEVQENENGEIYIVEKDASSIATEENIDDNSQPRELEIFYLPSYAGDDDNQEVVFQQEAKAEDTVVRSYGRKRPYDNGGEDYSHNRIRAKHPSKLYNKQPVQQANVVPHKSKAHQNPVRETQLKSNPNVILKHQNSTVHGHLGKSWTHKVDRRNYEPSAISSVTTIHTKPRDTESGQNEDRTIIKQEVDTHAETVCDDQRPYKCEYCEQAFRGSTSLHIHSSTFHKILPESCVIS